MTRPCCPGLSGSLSGDGLKRAIARVAREIFDYVLRDMTDKEGGFYSAEDADSLESLILKTIAPALIQKRGHFMFFPQSEIEKVLGKDTASIFNYCYGVLPQGNAAFDPHGEFTGKNILYLAHSIEEAADEFHRQKDEIQGILDEAITRVIRLMRDQRPRPHLDDKVLCDWNGLMIASFAFGRGY